MSAKEADKKRSDSSKKQEKNRGTQNELEILAQIVSENPYLRDNVLRRMDDSLTRKGVKREVEDGKQKGEPKKAAEK